MILLLLKQGMEEGKKGNRVIETYSYSTVYCAEKNENCDGSIKEWINMKYLKTIPFQLEFEPGYYKLIISKAERGEIE